MAEGFVQIWKALTVAYPTAPQATNRETMAIYERALSDIPTDVLKAAVLSAISTRTFFPAIAEIRELAFSAIEREAGLPTATEAWGAVCEAVRAIGIYGAPRWKYQQTADAVRAVGGWESICNSENPTADRARFIEAYSAIVARARSDARQLPEVRDTIKRFEAQRRAEQAKQLIAGAVKALEAK